ncbi:MAG: hypothetical protein Q9191_007610, partial [Dirinaria sp. TL-2023a]
ARPSVALGGSQLWIDLYSPGRSAYSAACSHRVSGRTGLLLVNEIDKSRDTNAEGDKIQPSEISWQSFVFGADKDNVGPSRLRCIVISHIMNEHTKDVIFQSIRSSTTTLEKSDGHKEFTETDDGFYALLGSQLGNLAVNMLLDHKESIGYKYVDRVVLFGKEGIIFGSEWGSARTLLMILSEPRSRKRASSAPPDLPSTTMGSRKRRRLSKSA